MPAFLSHLHSLDWPNVHSDFSKHLRTENPDKRFGQPNVYFIITTLQI